jgi:methylmalonyl-CoA mutase N-terminal domain/subunit
VNRFADTDDELLPTLYIGPEVEQRQLERLAKVRSSRSDAAVSDALARVTLDAGRSDVNLTPALVEAVRAYATVGEIVTALAEVFGRWTENPVI